MRKGNLLANLAKRGYDQGEVRSWRQRQHDAGRPSTLKDFLAAHQLCTACDSTGEKIVGCWWRDTRGVKHTQKLQERGGSEEDADQTSSDDVGPGGPDDGEKVTEMFDRFLKNAVEWGYLTELCDVCGGTGQTPP